jgi:hypothetical protein
LRFDRVVKGLPIEEQKELVRLLIRNISVKHFDPSADAAPVETITFTTKIRTKWYLVNISLFASDLFPDGCRSGEISSDLKKIGSRGRARSCIPNRCAINRPFSVTIQAYCFGVGAYFCPPVADTFADSRSASSQSSISILPDVLWLARLFRCSLFFFAQCLDNVFVARLSQSRSEAYARMSTQAKYFGAFGVGFPSGLNKPVATSTGRSCGLIPRRTAVSSASSRAGSRLTFSTSPHLGFPASNVMTT